MDKNTIIGFVLIAAVLIGFGYWSRPSKTEIAEQQKAAEEQAAKAQAEEAAQEVTRQEAQANIMADSTALFFAHQSGTARDITLKNDKVVVTLSTKGGTVSQAEILGYKNQEGGNVMLLSSEDSRLSLNLAAKTENIDLSQLYFDTEEQTDSTATLLLTAQNQGTLRICYKLRPGSYMLDMTIKAEDLSNFFTPNLRKISLDWQDKAKQQEKGYTFENRYSTLTYQLTDGSTKKLSETKDADKTLDKSADWIAFKNQFFSAIIIAHQDFSNVTLGSKQLEKGSGYLKEYHAQMEALFDPSGKETTVMQMYLGPNDFHILHSANKLSASGKDLNLHELVYFGWPLFRWINRYFIIYLFDFLRSFGMSMGLVLLLLTLIVKAIVYPATRKSYLSSARMRVLKPEIDKLNLKYPKKEDAMKKQQEMMQLYNQYGVSPMGGCLPMLIQMPVWIALFNFVPNAIELRGQSFLWVSDLSTYDTLISWHRQLWLLGDHISFFSLLFALTNVVNSWISMRQQQNAAMSAEQEQQMKMMKWMMYLMPIFFFFIFNDYSAGLCYYYFLSGLISILTMWGLRKFTNDDKLYAQLKAYKAKHEGDPKKVSGMAARLEAMQKLAEENQRKQRGKR
ncbi:MAG: membrane protein insertase YidC [Prevotellaceae bacterium]|nr:membrane protein insertase YidC [Prevotellaceae bacterium]